MHRELDASNFFGFLLDLVNRKCYLPVTQLWPNPPPVLPEAAKRRTLQDEKKADMSQRQSAMANLYEELRTIEVFDRVHDYVLPADPANEALYANRQVRRKQIMEEIANFKPDKRKFWRPAELGGAIAIICAVGYVMIYYSLK